MTGGKENWPEEPRQTDAHRAFFRDDSWAGWATLTDSLSSLLSGHHQLLDFATV